MNLKFKHSVEDDEFNKLKYIDTILDELYKRFKSRFQCMI